VNKTKPANKSKNKFKLSSPMYVGAAFLAIILIVISFRIDFNPLGQKVDVMPDSSHVPLGTDPGPYNTNPPTSGTHYADHFLSEFFDENSYNYPEGYLVHNLEHGYAIFWYNCDLLSTEECVQLKAQIKGVMEEANMYKVIAYPWPKIEVPVVITSWGRLLSMEKFNSDLALSYVRQYREKSPEPQGD
jgi:hypothetical protein